LPRREKEKEATAKQAPFRNPAKTGRGKKLEELVQLRRDRVRNLKPKRGKGKGHRGKEESGERHLMSSSGRADTAGWVWCRPVNNW